MKLDTLEDRIAYDKEFGEAKKRIAIGELRNILTTLKYANVALPPEAVEIIKRRITEIESMKPTAYTAA